MEGNVTSRKNQGSVWTKGDGSGHPEFIERVVETLRAFSSLFSRNKERRPILCRVNVWTQIENDRDQSMRDVGVRTNLVGPEIPAQDGLRERLS